MGLEHRPHRNEVGMCGIHGIRGLELTRMFLGVRRELSIHTKTDTRRSIHVYIYIYIW